jgi:hypothetical protein
MKPSITFDERGFVLHVTNEAGERLAIPLDMETAAQLALQLANVKAALGTPEGRRVVAKGLGGLFWKLAATTKGKKEDGTPETE